MGWFSKKTDPISDRARALNAEIASLESKIKKYESQVGPGASGPRFRSSTAAGISAPPPPAAPVAPVFEKVDTRRLMRPAEASEAPAHFNEFGVRKYDLPALLRRLREHFRGPTASNPKLVNYLAAGGIQGMRPLRREKRVARNRFIALVIILLLVLIGLITVFVDRR
jgi:hypothetical protein